jgi:uncharacterized protein with NRDE domain
VCTLAAFLGVFPDAPLVVAANRDEFLARATAPPGILRSDWPRAFGGRDLTAAGTWLGVNEVGLVAGMLNRRTTNTLDPSCRSRGQLCLDMLAHTEATEAAAEATAAPAARYNPFNLLVADPRGGVVVTHGAGEAPHLVRLERGLHLLSNLDVDDPRCPRIAASQQAFAAAGERYARDGDRTAFVSHLAAVLGDHTPPLDPRGPGGLCVHADGYGTRSSSVILVGADGRVLAYHHADGPPCRTALEPVALPF